ncbi:MAG: hypothetical protein WD401_05350 [Thermomicrobiaceae bacterium]
MREQYFDHVDQQYPYALIGPLREQIRVLEERADHYVHHVRMSDEDRKTMERVHALLAETKTELEKLRDAAGKPTA